MHKKMFYKFCIFILFLTPILAFASGVDGAKLSLLWCIPFACILLSIAIFPIILPKIWHHHFGKIIALLTICFVIPFGFNFGSETTIYMVIHALLSEYLPFIILLLSLFTVSGGILVKGNLHGSPKTNTAILAIGTLLASFMGTTGASMLLIRPLLRANNNRKHKVHVIVFFIFLVANIGGGLTPLGDPPLFLGFLHGVDFFWTIKHMLMPVIISSIILLTAFYIIEKYYYHREEELSVVHLSNNPIHLRGKINLFLLIGIICSVLLSGFWKSSISINIFDVIIYLQDITRDFLLLAIIAISLKLTKTEVHAENEFNWDAMLEVAKLFAGIFISIIPVLAILRAGGSGHLASLVSIVSDNNGQPINAMYFWITGILSGFLDNAPTYLIFFNLAHGDAVHMMTTMQKTLLSISMGAVFMGALTYVGNAPNFMIKHIAQQRGVQMPSFFGYMKWSITILVPLFILLTLIFFIF